MALKKELGIGLRVVVVQLESHQAAVVGGKDFMAEPLVNSDKGFVLDSLTRKGLDQFSTLKDAVRSKYIDWQRKRVLSILNHVKRVPPDSSLLTSCKPNPVLLIVFPEYSIPFEILPDIRDWIDSFQQSQISEFKKELNKSDPSNKNKEPLPWTVVVVAGTHTLPAPTKENLGIYRNTLKVDERELRDAYKSKLPTKSVAPIFYLDVNSPVEQQGNRRRYEIKAKLKLKRILSPFELTNMGVHTDDAHKIAEDVVTVPISLTKETSINLDGPKFVSANDTTETKGLHLSILPLICSEALQSTAYGVADFDILVIPAYQKEDRSFHPIIEQVSRNQRLVVFCNDGRHGGSGFKIPASIRGDSWWLGEPNYGRLPEGDGVIVADVTPLSLAEESQVNNPAERCQILRLSAVVPEDFENDSYVVAKILSRLRDRESQCSVHRQCLGEETVALRPIDLDRRNRILRDCLTRDITALQRTKIQRLLSIPFIDEELWKLHGTDFVASTNESAEKGVTLDDPTSESEREGTTQLNAPRCIDLKSESPEQTHPFQSLRSFEKRLAQDCVDMIDTVREANDLSEDQYEALGASRHICRTRIKGESQDVSRGRGLRLVESASAFLRKLSKEHVNVAQRLLAEHTADLVEKFQAASAWLLVNVEQTLLHPDLVTEENDFPLVCVVAHNGTPCRPLSKRGSMASKCLSENKPVVHTDIQIRQGASSTDEFYPVKPTTRSAIAVPVRQPYCSNSKWWPKNSNAYDSENSFCTNSKISRVDASASPPVIGVLVLESTQPFGLGPLHAVQLQAESQILTEGLIFIRSTKVAGKSRFLSCPSAMDWNLSSTLSDLCYSLSTTVPTLRSQPAFGMTIWRSDIARQTIGDVGQEYDFVYEVYARGFVRFDAEYIAHQSLPWVEMVETDLDSTQATQAGSESKKRSYAKLTIVNGKLRLKPASFVGSVVLSEGHGYVAKSWRLLPNYRRQDKGKRTELDHIFAVRLTPEPMTGVSESDAANYEPSLVCFPQLDANLIQANLSVPSTDLECLKHALGSVDQSNSAKPIKEELKSDRTESNRERLEAEFERHLQSCLGAITIYTYAGTTTDLRPFFSEPSLIGLGVLVSRFLEDSHNTRVEAAVARIRCLCQLDAITSVNAFNIIREWLMKVFDADGCSIFSCDDLKTNPVARCVTTSGLQVSGREATRAEAYYRMEKRSSEIESTLQGLEPKIGKNASVSQRSLTKALLTMDGVDGLRLNSRSDHVRASPPPNRFVEAYVLTWLEHRRNMFQKVYGKYEPNESTAIGLVRLVRSTGKPPFTPEDEHLIRVMCETISSEFSFRQCLRELRKMPDVAKRIANWSGIEPITAKSRDEERIEDDTRDEDACMVPIQDPNGITFYSRIGGELEKEGVGADGPIGRSEVYVDVCNRLIFGDPRPSSFGVRSIESILQDAFFAFDDAIPVLAMLRLLSTNERGQDILKVHCYHAHSSYRLTEDYGDLPVSENEGGIGWRAINEMNPIEFRSTADGFTRLFPFQDQVELGVCLPIIIPLEHHIVVGSLSVECKGVGEARELLERHVTLASLACVQIAIRASQGPFQVPVGDSFDESRFGSMNRQSKAKRKRTKNLNSPLDELAKCVDRKFPAYANSAGQSRFARLDPNLVSKARDLYRIGARINVMDGVCELPLWFGCGVLGTTTIQLDPSKKQSDLDRDGRDTDPLRIKFEALYSKSVETLRDFLEFCAPYRHKLELTHSSFSQDTRTWCVQIKTNQSSTESRHG